MQYVKRRAREELQLNIVDSWYNRVNLVTSVGNEYQEEERKRWKASYQGSQIVNGMDRSLITEIWFFNTARLSSMSLRQEWHQRWRTGRWQHVSYSGTRQLRYKDKPVKC